MSLRADMSYPLDKRKLKVAFARLIDDLHGLESAATLCRVNRSALGGYQKNETEGFAPIDVVADLEDYTEPHVTRALAARAGFVLVKIPDAEVTASCWLKRLAVLMKEGGEVAGAITLALSDDDAVNQAEAGRIIPELDELIEVVLGLRQQLGAVTE